MTSAAVRTGATTAHIAHLLADSVQPGTTYRDVYVSVEVLGHLGAECLGFITFLEAAGVGSEVAGQHGAGTEAVLDHLHEDRVRAIERDHARAVDGTEDPVRIELPRGTYAVDYRFAGADQEAHPPLVGTRFRANIIWLGRKAMQQGRDYKIKIHTAAQPVRIHKLLKVLDASELRPPVSYADLPDITLQQIPDSHSDHPARRIFSNTTRPWKNGRITSSDSTVKKLRQKVTCPLSRPATIVRPTGVRVSAKISVLPRL